MKYILIVVVLAILAFFGFKSCNNGSSLTDAVKNGATDLAGKAGDMAKDAANGAGDLAGKAGDMAKDAANGAGNLAGDALQALGDFFKRDLPGGFSLNIPKLGVENKLIDFIEGDKVISNTSWFDFDRINFNTGSSTLSESSKEQISNIAMIMRAYPNVKLKVGGYTDNTGSDATNLNISQKRAESVKTLISQLGVDAARLVAEGYGSSNPIATNETAEGRQKNRRISLKVTAK